MKKLIVVSDWAAESLSCQEVKSVVEGFLKNPINANINFVVSSSSTIHTSFLLSQVVETEERYGRPLETVIFQNTDQRLEKTSAVKEAKGADFLIIRLRSGIYVCGPNSGYDFSFIRDKIDEVFIYKDLNKGSQFRSRDYYSKVCAHLMDYMEDELDLEEVHLNIIPPLNNYYVVHVAVFGNIKTNIRLHNLKGKYEFGDKVRIKINEIVRKAMLVSNLFGGSVGELIIYPGSSGQKDDPFLEIAVRNNFEQKNLTTGPSYFNNPAAGTEIFLV